MANRYTYQFKGSFEPGVTDIYMNVTFGASGAPTLTAGTPGTPGFNENRGVTSIARTSAGKYTITFMDNWTRLLLVNHVFNTAGTSAAPASPSMYIAADNTSVLAAPTLSVVFNSAGTATDPASGEVALIRITFKNSSA